MALADAVKGARHTRQQITWQREDGTAVVLTGATLTGRLRSRTTGVARAMDGTLTLVDAAAGTFNWVYGVADIGTGDEFDAQFIATFADTLTDISFTETWEVREAL